MSQISSFLDQHVVLTAVAVFLLAASESIVVVGALVPGTALLLATGASIALAHLSLWPVLVSAI
jgi:membrane protein DedA with SNARE-associated domain